MRIIELNHTIGGGGGERMTVDLCNYFSKKGHDVFAYITDKTSFPRNISYRQDLDSRVRFASAEATSGLAWRAIWQTFLTIRREKPDVVHNHCNILLLLLPALFCPKVRYIHTIHTLPMRQYPGGIKKWVANWLYKTKRVIPVTISDECHLSYRECFGRQEDVQVTNGREALKTTNKLDEVKSELISLGISLEANVPIFIHVARHHVVKNHERLFMTFERLQKENVKFQLIVLGDRYEEYTDRLKNNPMIHLLGSRSNVADYMAFADYFVLTSDKEGLPLTLLEAMSMGVIPVCTPAGGIKDVIHDGINGFMKDTISDECFYESVKEALSGVDKISKDGIMQEFNDKYSMDVCARKYAQLYGIHSSDNE